MKESSDPPQDRQSTESKRHAILEAAIKTFGQRGSAKGTLADIAAQVGMTHAGVLHYFGSKQNLLLEMIAFRDRADVAELPEQRMPQGKELFRHLIQTAFANARRAGVVRVYTVLSAESVTQDHPARAAFEERYRVLRGEIDRAFHALCRQAGMLDETRIGAASAAILAVMDGLQLQWLLDPAAVDLGPASEFAIEAIVNAVLDPAPPLATPSASG